MRSRKGLLAGLVGALLALVVTLVLVVPAVSSTDPDAGPARSLRGAADDTTTPFNLVDVPALVHHRYDGHALHLAHRLDRSAAGVRWAITYRGDGRRLTGTLTLPRTRGPHPVVVTLHGYVPPPMYARGAGLHREEAALLRQGYVVLHPDYRNFAGSDRDPATARAPRHPLGYPADVLNAVVALRRANLRGVDTARMALLGRSMGGGVATQVAVARPSWFRALVLSSPVSTDAADDFDRWAASSPGLARRVRRAYGDPVTDPAFWHRASVDRYLDRLTMPVRIHHGTADVICPPEWSAATARAITAAGGDVRLFSYAGEEHRLTRGWSTFMRRTDAFLAAALR